MHYKLRFLVIILYHTIIVYLIITSSFIKTISLKMFKETNNSFKFIKYNNTIMYFKYIFK